MASLATETNSFSPLPAGALAFGIADIRRARAGEAVLPRSDMLSPFRACCEADGHIVVESLSAGAEPAGPTIRAAYEELRDMILADLRAAGPIDIVLLALHGSMVAHGYEDCEGDLLRRAREVVPSAVIGALLDPHASLTEDMVANADIITIMREYPHTDHATRGEDLYRYCLKIACGEIAPIAAVFDCRMIGFFPTLEAPMLDIVAAFRSSTDSRDIITAEFVHGFPWGDVPDMGARVLVYANSDASAALAEADRLAQMVYERRQALAPEFPDLTTSLDRAAALSGLTVLGDFADNPGGGAPGDSTFVLHELMKRGLQDAAIGAVHDPEAARLCCEAGAGAEIRLRLGGKLGPESGEPVDLHAKILATADDHGCTAFGMRSAFGRSAAIRAEGLDILIVSSRSQLYGTDGFTDLGITLHDKKLVIVKSSNHYAASFGSLADHFWHMATPGAMNLDFATIPYRRLDRPMFPIELDPWSIGSPPRARHVVATRSR